MTAHDWALVAPWWAWPRPAVPGRGRGTRPLLQKYDTPKLVDTFLVDPQRRRTFVDSVDRVVEYQGKTLAVSQPVPTTRRKLFQPSHFRHYLVVCSLHCDVPGLPPVDLSQVCQQGFVIRKRSLTAGDADTAAAQPKLAAVNTARRQLTAIDGHIAAARNAPNIPGVRLAALQVQRDATRSLLETSLTQLRAWAAQAGVTRSLNGWMAGDHDAEGDWKPVSEVPGEVDEAFYPLYPLIAPTGHRHDAAGQTIFFGLVPTASPDHDTSKEHCPRFDDHSAYEIRCFVRRHAPNCLNDVPSVGTGDCRGPLVWSAPTEVFGLAGHFDLRGTANRPINVQMPDLRQLRAQAGQLPAGVQFNTPPQSSVGKGGPTNDFQICSFSIPLITIVAMFVFQIFLPIVVFVFQLWFLLLLKFCIPPEVSLDAGGALDVALDIPAPQLEVDVGLQAQFDAATSSAIGGALGLFGPGEKLVDDPANGPDNDFKTQPRLVRRTMLRQLYGKDVLAKPVDDLQYVPRVELREVLPE
jgi:hypothetical protein